MSGFEPLSGTTWHRQLPALFLAASGFYSFAVCIFWRPAKPKVMWATKSRKLSNTGSCWRKWVVAHLATSPFKRFSTKQTWVWPLGKFQDLNSIYNWHWMKKTPGNIFRLPLNFPRGQTQTNSLKCLCSRYYYCCCCQLNHLCPPSMKRLGEDRSWHTLCTIIDMGFRNLKGQRNFKVSEGRWCLAGCPSSL